MQGAVVRCNKPYPLVFVTTYVLDIRTGEGGYPRLIVQFDFDFCVFVRVSRCFRAGDFCFVRYLCRYGNSSGNSAHTLLLGMPCRSVVVTEQGWVSELAVVFFLENVGHE